jgi:hypothetical protein
VAAENALYSLLTADSDVSALVGLRVSREPVTNPALAILPFITHERISTPSTPAARTGVVGYRHSVHEINCWAANPVAAKTLADHVRDALNQKGQITAGSTWIHHISVEDESAAYEERTGGRENRVWVVELLVNVWCNE